MSLCNRTCYIFTGLIVLIILSLGGFWWVKNAANLHNLEKVLNRTDQDPTHYVTSGQPVITISPAEQAQLTQTFLNLYFSPWDDDALSTDSIAQVLKKTQKDIDYYLQHPGFQFTDHPFSVDAIKILMVNADLTDFPRINRPGIIVHVTEAKTFPTLLPSYGDPSTSGEGYPFDNWRNSYLFPGAPVRVLHQSQDKLWYFVQSASFFGWIPRVDVGFVSPDFISAWKKNSFVVATRDGALRKGLIYPYVSDQAQQVQVLMPFVDANGNAETKPVLVDKADTRPFPILATPQNIALIANGFINGQYGWGNLYELRDCSSTAADIMASFGLFLPRNSTQQSRMGKVVPLVGSRKEKFNTLVQQGIPFFTLVHFPGHVGIYIGNHDGHIYVLQDVWGLHTQNILGRVGRGILARTVILPLDFSKNFSNTGATQLDRADSISILTPDSYKDEQYIKEKIWQ